MNIMNIHKPLLFWCSPLVQSLTHRQSRHNLKSPANHRVILGRTLRDPGGLHGTFMFFSPTPLRHTNDDRVQRRLFLDYGTRKTCTQSAAVRRLKPKNKNNGQQLCVHQMRSLQNASTPRAGWQAQHWDWQT